MRKPLQIQQLDSKMQALTALQRMAMPDIGWIKNIRLALGMSLQQLGNKLSVTKQSVQQREEREEEGSLTIKALKETAEALDMQFVYGFIPKDGSLEALIDRKATELATQIVMRTSATMKLEDQENSTERLQNAIQERAELLKREMPKMLWD